MKNTILKGKGFILRHVKLSDAKAFFEAEQDKEARRSFMRTPKNVKEIEEGIKKDLLGYKKNKPHREKFVIEVDGGSVGFIVIHSLNGRPLQEKGSIGVVGYALHLKFRGKGLATKSLKLLTDYSFKKFKLKRITGRCRSFNKSSARVLEKAGYKLEGIHKKEVYKDGKYYDNMYWARVR